MRNNYGFITINIVNPTFEDGSAEVNIADLDKETQESLKYLYELSFKKHDNEDNPLLLTGTKMILLNLIDEVSSYSGIATLFMSDAGAGYYTFIADYSDVLYVITNSGSENKLYISKTMIE